MKQKSRKYLGFTMIELLTVTVIIGLLMPSIIAIYSFLIKSNREFTLRQNAIQQGYEFFERLNILMQDYTIDYEEYYNRQMVGCIDDNKGENFEWNIGKDGYCTNFTAYGNRNNTNRYLLGSSDFHDIYYCSSDVFSNENTKKDRHNTVKATECGEIENEQSFGQYKAFFTDFHDYYVDRDDENVGEPLNNNINGIADANNIQELYLISHDGKRRLYFRRKFIQENGELTQYKIQMLRLRGFDAGQNHTFNGTVDEGSYDRQIDTWACDTSMGFVGHGTSVGGAYADYYLPKDIDDCWIDLSYGNTTVTARNISISPLNDPELYRNQQEKQLNPYMKILVVNGVYIPTYLGSSITEFKVPIETTINMKDFYKE